MKQTLKDHLKSYNQVGNKYTKGSITVTLNPNHVMISVNKKLQRYSYANALQMLLLKEGVCGK